VKKEYQILFAETGEEAVILLDMYEWFEIFRTGKDTGRHLEWIEPLNDSSKRVTFAENVNVKA
jgi:hypothetical protein